MKRHNKYSPVISFGLASSAVALLLGACTGNAQKLFNAGNLGSNVLSDSTGGSRVDGGDTGTIFNVTQVVNARPYTTADNSFAAVPGIAAAATFPFHPTNLHSPQPFIAYSNLSPTFDSLTPFDFTYSYPANNYKLASAHLVVELNRDDTGTESIFVDGVLAGRPVCADVFLGAGTPIVPAWRVDENTHPSCSTDPNRNMTAGTKNTEFIDRQGKYYRSKTINFADFDIDTIINWTMATTKPSDFPTARTLVSDGLLRVSTSDDSPIYQAKLFLNGYTVSKSALTCVNSPTYNFQNVYVHNDGNSITTPTNNRMPFILPSWTPANSVGASPSPSPLPAVANRSIDIYYAPLLPGVPTANVAITTAKLTRYTDSGTLATETGMVVRRNTAAYATAAIVINGYVVAQPGFDMNLLRSYATDGITLVLEGTITGAGQTYWDTWVNAIPNTNTNFTVTPANSLDLVQLLGDATLVRTMLAQGKLDVSFAGSIVAVAATGGTAARSVTARVDGPELKLAGTYFTKLCDVPNDPNSPLTDTGSLPTGLGDHASPVISSVQVVEITSSSAVIQWLTDEGATSKVYADFGTLTPTTGTTINSTLDVFHRVQLTGLKPYTRYVFQVESVDGSGNNNTTLSPIGAFATQR